jgi:hypothetical protein
MAVSGNKRNTPGKTAQPDFKRIKAKVGKKVPKAANDTDTAFKATSLHIAGQPIERFSSDMAMVSTRGRSLPELSSQLGHPAAAVRLSAMKGLGNVINQQSSHSLRPHLSIVLPACAKSCVDEDQDVRSVGLSVLGEMLPRQDEGTIRPFVPLLVAYTTSALHSLDSPMRVDGARTVHLLSTTFPALIKHSIPRLLPPFVSLLSGGKSAKKLGEILQALVSLLRTPQSKVRSCDAYTNANANHSEAEETDFVYLLGGRSRNTLVLETEQPSHLLRTLDCIQDMPSSNQLLGGMDCTRSRELTANTGRKGISGLSSTSVYDLLSKLRDTLVESSEQDISEPGGTTALDITKVRWLVQAIRLLWEMNEDCYRTESSGKLTENLDRLLQQIISLLLELFPITRTDVKINDAASIDALNASICSTLVQLASSTILNCKQDTPCDWIGTMCSYWLPRFDCHATEQSSSSALDVVSGLLLLVEQNKRFSNERLAILERLHKVFFERRDIEIARSPSGRKVALLVVDIMKKHQYRIEVAEDSYKETLGSLIQRLPFYLTAWGADYVFESMVVISLLRDIACHASGSSEESTFSSLREHTSELLVVGCGDPRPKVRGRSIFELYPVQLQRNFLGLLRMLRLQSSKTVKALASICARSNNRARGFTISAEINDEILSTIHATRMSLPMQDYLGFLLNSIGIPKPKNSKVLELEVDLALLLDYGVRRVSRAFIRCGSVRTFQMLLPQLSSWLDTNSALDSSNQFLRIRVAVAIFAMFSFDMKKSNDEASIFNYAPTMLQSLTRSVCQALALVSSSEKAMAKRSRLVSPFVALIQAEPLLLNDIFKDVANSMNSNKLRKSAQENLVELLVEIAKDPMLSEVIAGAHESVGHVRSIELGLGDGTSHPMVGQLRAILEVKTRT